MSNPSPDIIAFVRAKLSEPGQSMTALHRETGISKRWLELMRSGDIPNPGIENLTIIARHFGREIVLSEAS